MFLQKYCIFFVIPKPKVNDYRIPVCIRKFIKKFKLATIYSNLLRVLIFIKKTSLLYHFTSYSEAICSIFAQNLLNLI
jgi:hypothetical protein